MNFLPDEVVDVLSHYVSAYDMLLIYMAGSRALNIKLQRSASSFTLTASQASRMGSNSIPLASTYRFSVLTRISIVIHERTIQIPSNFVLDLPTSIEFLELNFIGVWRQFLISPTDKMACNNIFPTGETEKTQSIAVMNMAIKFPKLRVCLLSTRSGARSKSWDGWTPAQVSTLLSSMPSTIQTMNLGPWLVHQDIRLFPQSLLSYTFSVNNVGTSTDDDDAIDYGLLPRNTTDLKMMTSGIHGLDFTTLPRTIERLDMGIYHSQLGPRDFEGLPSSLTELNIDTSHPPVRIEGLPATLKHLKITSMLSPSDLKRLFKRLPSSGNDGNDGNANGNGLLSLHLDRVTVASEAMLPKMDALPLSLTKLVIEIENSGTYGDCEWKMPLLSRLISLTHLDICSEETSVNNGMLDFDPPQSIRVLKWRRGIARLDKLFLSKLPAGLEVLRLTHCVPTPSAFEGELPKGLLEFRTDTYKDEEPEAPIWLASISLPTSLHTLIFYGSFDLDKSFLSKLPRALTVLKVSKSIELTSISSLPPNLLELELTEHLLQDTSIAKLPRSLTSLTILRCTRLTDSCAEHLPPNLRVLSVNLNSNFSLIGVAAMPRSLRSLHLKSISMPNNPMNNPFKTVFEAVQALPPEVDLHSRTSGVMIRSWAESCIPPKIRDKKCIGE
jgi:hypothetical protein